jgi:hypothetical protein
VDTNSRRRSTVQCRTLIAASDHAAARNPVADRRRTTAFLGMMVSSILDSGVK